MVKNRRNLSQCLALVLFIAAAFPSVAALQTRALTAENEGMISGVAEKYAPDGWDATKEVNLTELGTVDWAEWGGPSNTYIEIWQTPNTEQALKQIRGQFIRKAASAEYISDFSIIQRMPETVAIIGNGVNFTWTDGTPVESGQTRGSACLWSFVNGSGGPNEFIWTVKADRTPKVLQLWMRVYGGFGKLVAELSDNSATAYVNQEFSTPHHAVSAFVHYTITFWAATDTATLKFSWACANDNSDGCGVQLTGATLALAEVGIGQKDREIALSDMNRSAPVARMHSDGRLEIGLVYAESGIARIMLVDNCGRRVGETSDYVSGRGICIVPAKRFGRMANRLYHAIVSFEGHTIIMPVLRSIN